MTKQKEHYLVTLTRPPHITIAQMNKIIKEAIQKVDTTNASKEIYKEVLMFGDVSVKRHTTRVYRNKEI